MKLAYLSLTLEQNFGPSGVLDAMYGSNKKFKSWLAELATGERELMGAANVDDQAVLKRARRELADAEPLNVQTI